MTAGILNINKPAGIASFPVVARVRRLTGVRRVGHAGTLDPIADGVLPVCLGPATRIVEYLVSAPKVYYATVRLGVATDTYDSEGRETARGDASSVTREAVERALERFTGEIQQQPPLYSALKHEGQPLYRYARAGKDVPRPARTVMVYRLALQRFEPPLLEIEMEVGRGAYVRTLAHELGEALGCHAHLERLTRLRTGPFTLDSAVTLDEFEAAVTNDTWHELLNPVDRVLEAWHAAILGPAHAFDARSGRLLVLEAADRGAPELPRETPGRAYSTDGDFLAVIRYQGEGRWHPEKVFWSPP